MDGDARCRQAGDTADLKRGAPGHSTPLHCCYSENLTMLENIALGILFFVALVGFYGVIAIHDIPYEIAKKRNHPQQDALHVAGWVSLFTLHVLWPFLWIWATLYREDRGWGFTESGRGIAAKDDDAGVDPATLQAEIRVLSKRLDELEQRVEK